MRVSSNQKKVAGFTLIELMIVIAMLGILASVGMTGVIRWLPNFRLKAAASNLYSGFQKAKLEAVKRNTDVVISLTTGAFALQGQVGGYTIFVDDGGGTPANAGNDTWDAPEAILANVTMPKGVSLISASFSATTTPGYNSRAMPLSNRFGNCVLRNSTIYYRIVMSSAGSIRTQKSGDGGVTWKD